MVSLCSPGCLGGAESRVLHHSLAHNPEHFIILVFSPQLDIIVSLFKVLILHQVVVGVVGSLARAVSVKVRSFQDIRASVLLLIELITESGDVPGLRVRVPGQIGFELVVLLSNRIFQTSELLRRHVKLLGRGQVLDQTTVSLRPRLV